MTTRYAVVEADPEAVETELRRLWRDNLPIPVESAERFAWARRAPESAPSVFVLTAEVDGVERAVGCAGVAERRFFVRGRALRAAQLVDLAVDRSHRALGPAMTLVRATQRSVLVRHAFAFGFPNAKARPLFLRAGYRELGQLTRWVRVLRHAPYLARHVGPRLAATGGVLLDAPGRAARARARRRSAAQGELGWVERADARFDALWTRARHEYDVVGRRDAEFLRWRFFDNPACRARAAVITSAAGELAAYAVVERRGDVAEIEDLFGTRGALGPLLDALLPALSAAGAASASCQLLGDRETASLLRARGFTAREQGPALLFDAAPELARRLARADRWYVTGADDDT